jgi:threonine/homoserine/homoserine lactone efflux protein
MIDPSLYAAFVAAVVVLMLIPGPNVALIIANSVTWGTRFGLLTVCGTVCAMIPQLLLTALGMTAVLATAGAWFGWLKWIGVAYLFYLGIKQWREAVADLAAVRAQPRSGRAIFARGFFVSLTNPKTLLFYGAFLPQFVTADRPVGPQLTLLCVTCPVIALTVDSLWATVAGRARGLLATHGKLRNRISGGFLMGAGVGLAMARVK